MDIEGFDALEIKLDTGDVCEQYKLLAENTVECIWLYDLETEKFRYISPSIMQLRGLTPEEAMLESLGQALTPESHQKVLEILEKRLRAYNEGDRSEKIISGVDEFQQFRKDGSIVDVEISTKFLRDSKTGHAFILGVSRDISDKKKLESKLLAEIEKRNKAIKKLQKSEKKLVSIKEELLENNKVLKALAITDELTGLYNRHYLDSRLDAEMERADRYGTPITLITFDLDHFKRVNDYWGHDFGDIVLSAVADASQSLVRKSDTLARWGGEEFAILAPETNAAGGVGLAEKIRKTIEALEFANNVRITASFGVGERLKDESYEEWFRRVDQALYTAKHQGRNRVVESNGEALKPIANVRIAWNPAWACGFHTIDEQHRRLIDMANDIIELSMTDIKSELLSVRLDTMISHIVHHFEDEEKIFELVKFPDAKRHASLHKALVEKASKLRRDYRDSLIKPSAFFAFLVDEVIVGHLLEEDVLFFPTIKKYLNTNDNPAGITSPRVWR